MKSPETKVARTGRTPLEGEARGHIEQISQDYQEAATIVLESLSGAVDRLGKAFSRRGHFVMEFLQNADDAHARRLRLEICDQEIRVLNDGDPFIAENVESICRVGRSSKPIEEYLGYLGVGFKSVFLISNSPQIHSGSYHFRFDRSSWPNAANLPWQVMPVWSDYDQAVPAGWNTAFRIPLKNPEMVEMLRNQVAPEFLDRRILLFLRSVQEIIIDDGKGSLRIIRKRAIGDNLYELEDQNGSELLQEQWVVFRRSCEVPAEVSKDYVTRTGFINA